MTYDPNNIFAKILRGEAPSFKVYEDDMTYAFMDVMPQAEGHTLVIPKFPAADIFDLHPDYQAAVALTTQKLAPAVKRAFKAPGIMIVQLNGAESGKTVFHFHNHIIPRFSGLELKFHARNLADFRLLKQHAEWIKAEIR